MKGRESDKGKTRTKNLERNEGKKVKKAVKEKNKRIRKRKSHSIDKNGTRKSKM